MAAAYDTPVVGWNAGWANTLRLWAAHSVEGFDLDSFNRGDFVGAATREEVARTISRVLYPDDTTPTGKELRLKQEYFFTAASLADILRRFMDEHGDLRRLPEKVAIQLNDTHPAIAGPELVRLLHDEHRIPFDEAMEIWRAARCPTPTTRFCPRRWSAGRRTCSAVSCPVTWRSWTASTTPMPRRTRRARSSIREPGRGEDGRAQLRHGHKVNGVSELHTDLMKTTVFEDLNRLHPDRIVAQTNGVTPRRWLLSCNPRLARIITDRIGEDWVGDLEQLSKLEAHVDDALSWPPMPRPSAPTRPTSPTGRAPSMV
jgi:starch phosphorylase